MGGRFTVTEKVPLFFAPVESVTVTVMGIVPTAVGVPLTAPELETLKPPLAEPLQVNGPVPPLTANEPEYGFPTKPVGKLAVMLSGAGVTVTEKFLLAVAGGFSLSLALTVKLNVPAVDGKPLSAPPEKLVPGGGVPLSDNEYGPTPPVTPKSTEMGVLTEMVAGGAPVIESVAGRIRMEKLPETVLLEESVAVTEKENVPGAVGVP